MTYIYKNKTGFVEREYKGQPPERIRVKGQTYWKYRIVFDGGIHAYTLTGDKLHKHEHRAYRTNKEIAEGLAAGTMRPPEGRDTTGDKQSRESVNQFNRMLKEKKDELGKPSLF